MDEWTGSVSDGWMDGLSDGSPWSRAPWGASECSQLPPGPEGRGRVERGGRMV
jgi:hypothetical protein